VPDHLREELDRSHTMRPELCYADEMGYSTRLESGSSLRMYSVRYTYLIFNFFLSYSIQVKVIDVFLPASKIFDPHRPQLPDFPLGGSLLAARQCCGPHHCLAADHTSQIINLVRSHGSVCSKEEDRLRTYSKATNIKQVQR
jgi:hypothetical protein